jgi:hypothetical protein
MYSRRSPIKNIQEHQFFYARLSYHILHIGILKCCLIFSAASATKLNNMAFYKSIDFKFMKEVVKVTDVVPSSKFEVSITLCTLHVDN